jgi:REP element-mobilizing transposase RayT
VEVSLKPAETISIAASKLKGKVSGWIRNELELELPERLLSTGYFACTVGNSTSSDVDEYLSKQGDHHGYAQRRLPPIYTGQFEIDESRVTPKHAAVISRFHCVLATSGRKGVFGAATGKQLTAEWKRLQAKRRFQLLKVSFVPDHVHLALRLHPAVSPAQTVVELMNVSQEFMKQELVAAGINRLWQPSAYIGSYGDLSSPQIRKYIENWSKLV